MSGPHLPVEKGNRPRHVGVTRRGFIGSAALLAATLSAAGTMAQVPPRLLLVHGRGQAGRDPATIRAEWLAALEMGAQAAGVTLPAGLDIRLPFYGDQLDALATTLEVPLTSEIITRGDGFQDEFLAFQAEIANDLREAAGVSDAELDEAYGDNPKERSPQNWEWVQAIIRAIDGHNPDVSAAFLERFLRDVFLYVQSSGVRDVIDGIVRQEMDQAPTVVVAHSLGTVVAYHILHGPNPPPVPLFLTLGSPLAINAIKRRLAPIGHPTSVATWLNAYDERDIVALRPLNAVNFDVTPPIRNIGDIRNQTDNRHGIAGYLDKPQIVGPISAAL